MKREPLGPPDGPTTATIFDPVAWERRVAEARLRRDRILAKPDAAHQERDRALRCERIGRAPLPRPPLPRASLPEPGAELPAAAFAPLASLAAPRETTSRGRIAIPVVAAALVAGWMLFDRPDTQFEVVPKSAPAPSAASLPSMQTAAIPPANPDATVPLPPAAPVPHQHIKLLAPAGLAPENAEAAAESLRAAGFAVTGPVAVPLTVSQANARYFHEADRSGLTTLIAALAPLQGTAPELRGFTDLPDAPPPGRVEVWLAGPAQPAIALAGASPPEQIPAAVDADLLGALVSIARTGE